jgi:hypothetical protein
VTVQLMPSIEAVVSSGLRADPQIAAIVEDRVFTVLPNNQEFPLLLITRLGGEHITLPPPPLWVEDAFIQWDCYADTKYVASLLMETVRAVLVSWIGTVRGDAVVINFQPGSIIWLPDDSYAPVKPRYVIDGTLTYRMAGSPGH